MIKEYSLDQHVFAPRFEDLIRDVYMNHDILNIKKDGVVIGVVVHPDELAALREEAGIIG